MALVRSPTLRSRHSRLRRTLRRRRRSRAHRRSRTDLARRVGRLHGGRLLRARNGDHADVQCGGALRWGLEQDPIAVGIGLLAVHGRLCSTSISPRASERSTIRSSASEHSSSPPRSRSLTRRSRARARRARPDHDEDRRRNAARGRVEERSPRRGAGGEVDLAGCGLRTLAPGRAVSAASTPSEQRCREGRPSVSPARRLNAGGIGVNASRRRRRRREHLGRGRSRDGRATMIVDDACPARVASRLTVEDGMENRKNYVRHAGFPPGTSGSLSSGGVQEEPDRRRRTTVQRSTNAGFVFIDQVTEPSIRDRFGHRTTMWNPA